LLHEPAGPHYLGHRPLEVVIDISESLPQHGVATLDGCFPTTNELLDRLAWEPEPGIVRCSLQRIEHLISCDRCHSIEIEQHICIEDDQPLGEEAPTLFASIWEPGTEPREQVPFVLSLRHPRPPLSLQYASHFVSSIEQSARDDSH
jgi:hypothetical protein